MEKPEKKCIRWARQDPRIGIAGFTLIVVLFCTVDKPPIFASIFFTIFLVAFGVTTGLALWSMRTINWLPAWAELNRLTISAVEINEDGSWIYAVDIDYEYERNGVHLRGYRLTCNQQRFIRRSGAEKQVDRIRAMVRENGGRLPIFVNPAKADDSVVLSGISTVEVATVGVAGLLLAVCGLFAYLTVF